jgi:hypothetical protein
MSIADLTFRALRIAATFLARGERLGLGEREPAR